jgi:hypothetical protein
MVVNDEQADLIAASETPGLVRDRKGRTIGRFTPSRLVAEFPGTKARLAAVPLRSIVVNDKQAALIRSSDGKLQVRNRQGGVIGHLTPWPPAGEIAEAQARLAAGRREPAYTTAQVLEYLRSLDER